MIKTILLESRFYSKILSYGRVAYCSIPNKTDNSYVYKPKPEDIPEGIWAEDKHPKFTGVEEVKGHWYYVEHLFPKFRIPEPVQKESSTGWKAPLEKLPDLPYFIKRTRNHMLPVFVTRIYEEKILVTKVKYIHGDIWLMEYDLKSYLEEKLGETVLSNVNEIARRINFKGDHKKIIEDWLYSKGF